MSIKTVIMWALMGAACSAFGAFKGALLLDLLLARSALDRAGCRGFHPVPIQLLRIQESCNKGTYFVFD